MGTRETYVQTPSALVAVWPGASQTTSLRKEVGAGRLGGPSSWCR